MIASRETIIRRYESADETAVLACVIEPAKDVYLNEGFVPYSETLAKRLLDPLQLN